MDLANLSTAEKSEQGAVLHLKDPGTGELLFNDEAGKDAMTLTLAGSDSDLYRKKLSEIRRRNERKKFKTSEKEDEENIVEQLEAMTLDCNVVFNGKKLTVGEVCELYRKAGYKWLKEQALVFIHDRANFLPNA